MHRNHDICHGDVTSKRVYLGIDGQVKLMDVGLLVASTERQAWTDRYHDRIKSQQWPAPELLNGTETEVTKRSEIWALGILAYELACGQKPWSVEAVEP